MDDAAARLPLYELGTGNSGSLEPAGNPSSPNPDCGAIDLYMMHSNGPDKTDDTPINSFPWRGGNATNDVAGVKWVLDLIYDSTNGTRNKDTDIFRVGGSKPAGMAWDALWNSAD